MSFADDLRSNFGSDQEEKRGAREQRIRDIAHSAAEALRWAAHKASVSARSVSGYFCRDTWEGTWYLGPIESAYHLIVADTPELNRLYKKHSFELERYRSLNPENIFTTSETNEIVRLIDTELRKAGFNSYKVSAEQAVEKIKIGEWEVPFTFDIKDRNAKIPSYIIYIEAQW